MEHEGKYLEYKETVSRTYLKTVSAFANYGPGTIIFGITDDFQTVGVADPLRTALDIENQINDNIIPGPDYSLAIREDNTIALTVNKGKLDRLPSSVNGLSRINSASNNAILESGREAPYVQEIAVQRPDFC